MSVRLCKLKYFVFFIIAFCFSCMNVDCVEVSKIYREKECLIIVKNIPHKYGSNFEINGKSLKTGKDTLYDEENRWFCDYYENIDDCVNEIVNLYEQNKIFYKLEQTEILIQDIYFFLNILKKYNLQLSFRYNFFILSLIPVFTIIIKFLSLFCS